MVKLARRPIGTCEPSDEQWMVGAIVHEILHLYVNPEIVNIQDKFGHICDNCYNELIIDLLAQWSTTPKKLDIGASVSVATSYPFTARVHEFFAYSEKLKKLLSSGV
jgi:hypothetical protein